jgi:putative endonuclease
LDTNSSTLVPKSRSDEVSTEGRGDPYLGSPSTGSGLCDNVILMPWFVYILLCDQKTFYIGTTDNLERRLSEHRNKRSFFTKKFSDIELVYEENYKTRSEAGLRERQLKKWSIAKKRALISGNKELLTKLSKCPDPGEGIPVN